MPSPKSAGARRSAEIRRKVLTAMRAIRNDIKCNNGIYPHGKSISANELARRAAIHPTTFHTSNQRKLGARVRKWIMIINSNEPTSAISQRRPLNQRLADWRERYMGLAQAHRDTELDLHQAQAELANAILKIDELQALISKLRAELNQKGGLRIVT